MSEPSVRLVSYPTADVPSRTDSLVFWKQILSGKVPEYEWIGPMLAEHGWKWGQSRYDYLKAHDSMYDKDYCGFCDSAGQRYEDGTYGNYICLCELLNLRDACQVMVENYGSAWRKEPTLENMELIGTPQGKSLLEKAINRTRQWIEEPRGWLVYSGPTGTGKTHMMSAIMNAWHPYSIYLVASDFEGRLRAGLNAHETAIQEYMGALVNHPILILDDLGIEYSTSWIKAKMDDLIETRSRLLGLDRLTIVGTNIRQSDIIDRLSRDGVSRSGSRLTDRHLVEWIPLQGLDYRNMKI